MNKGNYLVLFIRPFLIAILLGVEFLFIGNLGKSGAVLLTSLISGGVLISLIGYILQKISNNISLYAQLFLDVLLSSVILYFTGGIESPYFILYFIDIIVASIFLFAKGSFITSITSIIFFVVTVYLRSKYTFLIPQSFTIFTSNISRGLTFVRAYTYSLAFLTVGALSAYVSEILLRGKKNLQEIKITLNDIIKSFNDAIITLDRNGYIKYFNSHSRRFLVATRPIINRNYKEVIIEELVDKLGGIENIGRRKFEIEMENIFYEVIINRIDNREGKIIGYNIFIADITEQKKDIEKEKEIERLRAISNLSAAVVHEIGNPLASIKGATEVVMTSLDDSSEEKPLLQMIMKESDRLAEILNKFRQISKKRWIKETIYVNISEEIEYAVNIAKHDKLFKDITFQVNCFDDSIVVFGARELKEVFSNLIRNAAQSMDYKGTIKLKCYSKNGNAYIVIKDNGKGIEAEALKNIFKPYYSMKKGGMGLGLTISKQIIEEIGGNIDVESVKGEGTKVTLILRQI